MVTIRLHKWISEGVDELTVEAPFFVSSLEASREAVSVF